MLSIDQGKVQHVNKATPHHIQVPSRREVEQAWTIVKKRLKADEYVALLDRYLLTR